MTEPSPIKILMVDASSGDVRLAKEALRECKVQNDFEAVSDGLMALDYLNGRLAQQLPLPDVILMDLNLPGLDGRKLLELLRETEHFAKIPIVILTSSDGEADILRTFDLGVDCFARKPIDMQQFVQVVATLDRFYFSVVTIGSNESDDGNDAEDSEGVELMALGVGEVLAKM